jgi:hypothetical protein
MASRGCLTDRLRRLSVLFPECSVGLLAVLEALPAAHASAVGLPQVSVAYVRFSSVALLPSADFPVWHCCVRVV